eukprot:gene951-1846_t
MSIEYTKKRATYAWALYFFEGMLLGVGLPIIPYIVNDVSIQRYDNSSNENLFKILTLVIVSFYLGRFITIFFTSRLKDNAGQLYKVSFVIASFLAIPTLILFGYASNTIWLVITRTCCGLISGYCANLVLHIEPKPYNYSAWLYGTGMSSFITSFFYASSSYRGQLLSHFSTDLQQHPGVVGVCMSVTLFVLVIIRVRYREAELTENYDPSGSWGEGLSICNPVFEDIDLESVDSQSNYSNQDGSKHAATTSPSRHEVNQSSRRGGNNNKSSSFSNSSVTMMSHGRADESARKSSSLSSSSHRGSKATGAGTGTDTTRVSTHSRHSGIANGKDGTAYVESDSEDHSELQVPSRYIRGCGEYEEALRRWRLTLDWRKEFDVDSILQEPQPDFNVIKDCYPHFIHGRSRFGQPVYYELLGKINIKRLQDHGVSVHRLLRYYIFITEYIWAEVEPDDDHGQLVTILDVSGVGVADLMGDALEFMKEASKVIQSHYVERCKKMFIVNAPFFFNMLWRIISPMLHENTRRKISILGVDKSEILLFIDAKQLPAAYGGTGPPLGTSVEEINLRNFVARINSRHVANLDSERRAEPLQGLQQMSKRRRQPTGPRPNTSANASTTSSNHQQRSSKGPSTRTTMTNNSDLEGEPCSTHSHLSIRSSPIVPEEIEPPKMKFRFGLGTVMGVIGVVSSGAVEGIKKISTVIANNSESSGEAHLGQENAYEYDADTGMWVLRKNDIVDRVYEDESEKRLVRAIQAAQGMVDESEFGDDDEEEEVILYDHNESSSAISKGNQSQSSQQRLSRKGNNNQKMESNNSSPSKGFEMEAEEEEVDPEKAHSFLVYAMVYILWRGAIVCVLESLVVWMFLSEMYGGLGMAPYASGIIFLVASLLVLFAKNIWQHRYSTAGYFPLMGFRIATMVMQIPCLFLLITLPFSKDTFGKGFSRNMIVCAALAVHLACQLVAIVGSKCVCDMLPSKYAWLYGRIYLAESIGAVLGIVLLRVSVWLPFTLAV